MRKGRSASSLGTPGPPRERRRALAGTFLPKDPWAAAASAPRPWPGQVCARGEPAAGVSAFTARLVLFVCLPRAGSSLFTGESHPETQALFLSGLSQVEESIKPPDRGKGRHSGTQSENHHRPPGARQRPLQRRTARPGPAMPALWLSCCLCVLLLPAARATFRREGESVPGGKLADLGCEPAFLCRQQG